MTVLVANRLNGPVGAVPTAASLAASGDVGTVSIASANPAVGGRAEYSGTHTIHGLSTIRLDSGHHRGNTPRLTVPLPESGPWWVRWYVWMPRLQDAGLGTNEVRWVARFPSAGMGLVYHATAAGNIGSRLQADDLAAAAVAWDVETGTSVPTGQWWRVELSSDGTDFTSSVSNEDGSRTRVHTWTGRTFSGSIEITGYRYRRGVLLRPGDNDAARGDTAVSDMQRALMELGYDLPMWGADGWYGQEATDAVFAFQQDHGYDVVDGIAGPETLAGIDLALRLHRDEGYPPSLWVSHVAVSDSGPLGPAEPPRRAASAGFVLSGSAVGDADYGPAVPASAGLVLSGSAGVAARTARTSAVGVVRVVGGSVPAAKHGTSSATAGFGLADGGATAAKHGTSSATAGFRLADGGAWQVKHGTSSATAGFSLSGIAFSDTAQAIVLDYAAGHVSAPFEPVEDDQRLANDVTAKRERGSEYRATLNEGPLSVQDPPDGVGRYETSVTLNTANDRQLWDQARWRVHVGTWDDARYPTVTVNLAANPGLIENVTSRDSGDALQVINPPPWLPPEPIDLLIEGYDERLNAHAWDVTFNASSGGPWIIGEIADPGTDVGTREPNRTDTDGAELAAAVGAGDTVLSVTTTRGPRWVTTAEEPGAFPLDVMVAGEVVRVVSITGEGTVQTFLVARAMNGIAKSHAAGTPVHLVRPAIVGL